MKVMPEKAALRRLAADALPSALTAFSKSEPMALLEVDQVRDRHAEAISNTNEHVDRRCRAGMLNGMQIGIVHADHERKPTQRKPLELAQLPNPHTERTPAICNPFVHALRL